MSTSQTPQDAYLQLQTIFATVSALMATEWQLGWDQQTMMPKGGAGTRGRQMAAQKRAIHQQLTNPRIPELLARANETQWGPVDASNLRLMGKLYAHTASVDANTAAALARAKSDCVTVWSDAKISGNPFPKELIGLQQRVFDLTREEAAQRAEGLGLSDPYDALIDHYDPGMKTEVLDRIFEGLREHLTPVREALLNRQQVERNERLPRPFVADGDRSNSEEPLFPKDKQMRLCRAVLRAIGFDFNGGRLDESAHPFCLPIGRGDIRMTTRFDPLDPIGAVFSAAHEVGHGMYERFMPLDTEGQPVGMGLSMASHEMMSLIMEKCACSSQQFMQWLEKALREEGLTCGRGTLSADNLYRHRTWYKPHLIRTESHPVEYPFHIMLRYRLEKQIMRGDLKAAELEDAWNELLKELLGLVPTSPRDGFRQDVHWHEGLIGYYPSYTLGAMGAFLMWHAVLDDHGEILEELAQGNFATLVGWLKKNVYSRGLEVDAEQLLRDASGFDQGYDPFLFSQILRMRYVGEKS